MRLDDLIDKLQELSNEGYGGAEVFYKDGHDWKAIKDVDVDSILEEIRIE